MGQQQKYILAILVILVVAGLAGLGIYYATQEPGQTDVAGTQDQDTATAPAGDQAGEEAATAGEAVAPRFDIVRVEPSGEVVAAGRASVGARVELLLGDDVISSAEANAGGEWALVFEEPLKPGSYDLALRATGPDGAGEMVEGDRVTVVIEGPDKTPLVAVTRPGQPTEVLQTPAETGETAMDAPAGAPTETSGETVTAEAKPQEPAAGRGSTPEQQAAEQPAAEQPAAEQAGAEPRQTAEAGTSAQAGAEPAQEPAGQPASPQEPADQETAAQESGADQPASGEQVAAATPEQPTGEEPAAPAVDIAIETVEVEDPDRLMLGGRSGAGQAVRVYMNNERLADVEAGADGRWTLSAERPMPPGRYEVRADAIGADGAVQGRAEVKFDRVRVVAEGDPAADEGTTGPTPEPTVSGAAGAASEGSEVTIVSRTAGSGAASSGAAVGEGAGTSVVVIARGDNLWRIARKLYGQGVRHTVIYEANRNQIRNPHLIYPGQVFTIPVLEDEEGPKG